jgi:hypothetical protein
VRIDDWYKVRSPRPHPHAFHPLPWEFGPVAPEQRTLLHFAECWALSSPIRPVHSLLPSWMSTFEAT